MDLSPLVPGADPSTRLELEADQQLAALAGAFGIMELWGADNAQMRAMLGDPAQRTFFEWKSGRARRIPADTLRRVGYLAGIYKALQILYSNPGQADAWPRVANRAFGGQTPLERMAAGDVTDLAAVRTYLDSARSPWG